MNCRAASIFLSAFLALSPAAKAQSFFALPEMLQQNRQSSKLSFDYDVDFQYNIDARNFKPCDDLLSRTMVINNIRLTPSVGLAIQQDRNTRHRLMFGVNVMKDLGANPVNIRYIEDEGKENLRNLALFRKVLVYYDYQKAGENGLFEAKAGIFSNSARSGYYSRAIFSDVDNIYNSEIEGAIVKFESRKFKVETGLDCMSSAALERLQSYVAFTSGEYQPFKWGAIGWDGSYATIRPSVIFDYDVDAVIFNPYMKFDLGYMLRMQELSLRAGGLMSYQISRLDDAENRFPMGAEAVFTAKNWNFGVEDTFFFGDNMMPFRSRAYSDLYSSEKYTNLLYRGDDPYFTQRGYASMYNRVELFYQPEVSEYFTIKASAVAHIISSTETVMPFAGWQVKLSAVMNLDMFRNSAKHLYGKPQKSSRHRQPGPSFKL